MKIFPIFAPKRTHSIGTTFSIVTTVSTVSPWLQLTLLILTAKTWNQLKERPKQYIKNGGKVYVDYPSRYLPVQSQQ